MTAELPGDPLGSSAARLEPEIANALSTPTTNTTTTGYHRSRPAGRTRAVTGRAVLGEAASVTVSMGVVPGRGSTRSEGRARGIARPMGRASSHGGSVFERLDRRRATGEAGISDGRPRTIRPLRRRIEWR